jgi:hypothetical protein
VSSVEVARQLIAAMHSDREVEAEVRRAVLTDDLLSLPELTRRLAEAQGRTEACLSELTEAQGRTEARLSEQLLGSLDEAAAQELQRADALVEAEEPGTGVPVVLVIEAAWVAHVHDVERAARRAGLLTSAGVPAMGLVVSQARPAPPVLEAAQTRSVALTSEAKGLLVPSRPSTSP